MKDFLRVAAVVALVMSLRVVPAFCQVGSAALRGKVVDASGLAVVGVNVQAVNTATNVSYPTTTNEAGIYSLPTLPPATYRITVEKEGFEGIVRPDVVLHVADNISIDFTLQVGAVAQTMTVEGGAPPVNTTNSSLGGLVQADEVANLPLNGRNYINLTLMQPGISPMPNLSVGGSFNGTWYSSNGATLRSNNFLLDGAIMQDPNGGSSSDFAGRTLGLDGIQEYRVITSNFSAEYGFTMGSQTIMVSKSGTNQFHGSAFEYLRNSVLDAANFFDKGVAINNFQRLPPFKRNNFGGSFGGPIQKDKTFFFATFEGVEERLGVTVNNTVPAMACRGPVGTVVWNGKGTQPAGSVGPCTQLGTNPSDPTLPYTVTIAAAPAPLLAIYPLPNIPGGNQFTTPYSQPDRDVFGQIRVDHVFSDKDSAFVRYTIDDDNQVVGLTFPELFVNPRLTRHQYATLSENHIFATSLLNNFRVSFSRTASNRTSPDPFIGPQYSLVAGNPLGQMTIGGINGTFGPIANPGAEQTQNILTLSDDLMYTAGRHSLKFGASINNIRQYGLTPVNIYGKISFASLATFLAGTASSFTGVLPTSNITRTWQYWDLGFYVQDDWRVRSNFTVNAGLRYEPAPNYIHEVFGVSSSLINPLTDTTLTVGPMFQNPTLHNFSPRLGFAWDVWGNGKTAVRGGAALMYDITDLYNGLYGNSTSVQPFSFTNVGSGAFTLPLTFSGVTSGASTVQYNLKQARLYTENLTVEQQVPFSMVLSVSYVGSRGEHLTGIGDDDPNLPMGFTNGIPFWDPNPADTIPKTNPHWTSVLLIDSNGDSVYNALQVVLTKRVTKGLQFQSSYTWSKLLDNSVAELTGDCTSGAGFPSDPYSGQFDRGPSCLNIPHNWVFNAIYTFPSPKVQERFLAALTSGWGMNGIFTVHSGFPFNPEDSGNRSRSGISGGATPGIDRPNFNPAFTGNVIEGTPTQWFNPAAYVLQPVGTLGNVGRDSLIGPGFNELDFAVVKNTKLGFLGEAGNLTFRAEFFNIFNHPNFAMPSNLTFPGTLTDPVTEAPLSNVGQITSTGSNTSRQVELSLRLAF